MSAKFSVGDNVVDRDGFHGTVVNVTEWNGAIWYDVQFGNSTAVRFTSDLTMEVIRNHA